MSVIRPGIPACLARLLPLYDAIREALHLLWAFTESDFVTFAIPNTMFGTFLALSDSSRVYVDSLGSDSIVLPVLLRLPLVIFFNWANLLVFDLSNQYPAAAVQEDAINKPWRPIPSGKVTSAQARQALACTIPVVLCINYCLGVWSEGALIHIASWIYNELGGGDGLMRNPIIAVSYAAFNMASLKLAIPQQPYSTAVALTPRNLAWIAAISGVILTTMHVQDLKDQDGDAKRSRKTIPLAIGDLNTRWSLIGFIGLWSCICVRIWPLCAIFRLPLFVLAVYLMYRIYTKRSRKEDATSWRIWCLWTVFLYQTPLLARLGT